MKLFIIILKYDNDKLFKLQTQTMRVLFKQKRQAVT